MGKGPKIQLIGLTMGHLINKCKENPPPWSSRYRVPIIIGRDDDVVPVQNPLPSCKDQFRIPLWIDDNGEVPSDTTIRYLTRVFMTL